MRKLNFFLSLILILVMGTAASAQTVDDVISKATAAVGGQSAIDAVKSLRMNISGKFVTSSVVLISSITPPSL